MFNNMSINDWIYLKYSNQATYQQYIINFISMEWDFGELPPQTGLL